MGFVDKTIPEVLEVRAQITKAFYRDVVLPLEGQRNDAPFAGHGPGAVVFLGFAGGNTGDGTSGDALTLTGAYRFANAAPDNTAPCADFDLLFPKAAKKAKATKDTE